MLDLRLSRLLVVCACHADEPGWIDCQVGDGEVGRTALDINSVICAGRRSGVHDRPAAQGKPRNRSGRTAQVANEVADGAGRDSGGCEISPIVVDGHDVFETAVVGGDGYSVGETG